MQIFFSDYKTEGVKQVFTGMAEKKKSEVNCAKALYYDQA